MLDALELIDVSISVEVDFNILENIGIVSPNLLNRDESLVIGITGDIPHLGQWNPNEGVIGTCQNVLNADLENWVINFKATGSFKYRLFLAQLSNINSTNKSRDILRILAWESRLKPRELNIPVDSNCIYTTNISFGGFDNGIFIQRGCLKSHSEIHIRISESSCKLFRNGIWNSSTYSKLFISCSMFVLQPGLPEDDDDSNLTVSRSDSLSIHGRPVLVSTLEINRCRIHRGENKFCSGTLYKPGDHVQFFLETNDPENTAIEVEFYQESDIDTGESGESVKFIGSARFGPFEDTHGRKASQILSPKRNPIGDLRVNYLVIHPMTDMPEQNLEVTYKHHWKKRAAFNIGHRGVGTSFLQPEEKNFKIAAPAKENTLESFRTANLHGADFVEMDVQLTKDHRVVVYHDYEAVVISKKELEIIKVACQQNGYAGGFNLKQLTKMNTGPTKRGGKLSYLPIAIKDLNYEDLRELKVHHSSVLKEAHDHEKMDEEDLDPIERQAFPLLSSCFEGIDSDLGFVIEVKYPMELRTGGSEMPNFFEYNFYVDTILREILTLAGSRRIILSCFDPNVCIMLQLKQNKYPVFQLGIAAEYSDSRQADVERLFCSALSHELTGVCLESDRLIEVPHLIHLAHAQNLVVLAWGEAVNYADKRALLSELGVDGIIYDRLHENKEKGALSVFKRERSAVSSPVPSESYQSDCSISDYNCGSPGRSEIVINPIYTSDSPQPYQNSEPVHSHQDQQQQQFSFHIRSNQTPVPTDTSEQSSQLSDPPEIKDQTQISNSGTTTTGQRKIALASMA